MIAGACERMRMTIVTLKDGSSISDGRTLERLQDDAPRGFLRFPFGRTVRYISLDQVAEIHEYEQDEPPKPRV